MIVFFQNAILQKQTWITELSSKKYNMKPSQSLNVVLLNTNK